VSTTTISNSQFPARVRSVEQLAYIPVRLEQSRSQRILWLLEELKLPYELEIFHRDKKTLLAPPELKEIHPLGKSPVISITPAGATESTIIAESALIIEYLLEHFGQSSPLLPARWITGQEGRLCGETPEWLRYKYFLHYAEGSLMPLLLVALVAGGIKNSPVPFFIWPITTRIAAQIHASFLSPHFHTHFAFLEDQLRSAPGGGGYLCGPSLTGADILLSFPLLAAKGRVPALEGDRFPLLLKYIDRLEQEPGYKKAVDKIVEIEGSFSVSP
jgi:glutathione S-transferase